MQFQAIEFNVASQIGGVEYETHNHYSVGSSDIGMCMEIGEKRGGSRVRTDFTTLPTELSGSN